MFANYLKTAIRRLLRNRSYTIINIAGLAVAVAVCVVIFAIIQYHTSFDAFHPNKDRIYRVLTQNDKKNGEQSHGASVPFPLPSALEAGFSAIEQVAPIYASHNDELQVVNEDGKSGKSFKEQNGVFYTSPAFFEIFNFPLLAGSYESLNEPNNVLLTKEVAETYFGDWKTATGKSIRLTGSYRLGSGLFQFPPIMLKVTGVLASVPPNTDFNLKLVIAFGTDFTGDDIAASGNWKDNSPEFGCYVLLRPKISKAKINNQLQKQLLREGSTGTVSYPLLQPLSDVHYDALTGNYRHQTITHELINALWLIAAFILLIACVNFVNLATAQAVNRAKEIGVRKVMGSNKLQLQIQFMIETFLIVMTAVLLAMGIFAPAMPFINQLLGLDLSFEPLKNPSLILFLLTLSILVTAIAGFYPSFVLSGFNPINALKSKLKAQNSSGISLRRGLVVCQFIIAQALIIGTLIIVKQMNYVLNQPLGFDKEAILSVPFRPDNTGSKLSDYLRQRLLAINGVRSVSFSSNSPVENNSDMMSKFKFDHAISDAAFQAILQFADHEYVPNYKLTVVAGRNLHASDYVQEFLVNESLVKSLGLKNEDVLNKNLSMWDDRLKGPVVGVLKDFSNQSFRHALAPMIITTNITMYRQIAIKLETFGMSSTLPPIKKIWEGTFPGLVYEYRFLNEKIEDFYKQERQLSQLYTTFAAISIFLSCLGLYGLASFVAAQRIKEIGIRKVLGASPANIVCWFSKEFVSLIVIAVIIATPVVWIFMNQWLQNYAYQTTISWWVFGAGGLASIVIAFGTISFQALKVATTNPVKSLQAE